jgi:CheY-like chemotaxis protein
MTTILLIEDSEAFRTNAVALLNFAGYQVIAASDGETGVQLAQEHQPDVILCDMSMPGMRGDVVYETLQTSELTAQIPFIFLTGLTEAIPKGMRHLSKPLKLETLLAALQELAAR